MNDVICKEVDAGICGSLNVIGFHKFVESGTIRSCGFVVVLSPVFKEINTVRNGIKGVVFSVQDFFQVNLQLLKKN